MNNQLAQFLNQQNIWMTGGNRNGKYSLSTNSALKDIFENRNLVWLSKDLMRRDLSLWEPVTIKILRLNLTRHKPMYNFPTFSNDRNWFFCLIFLFVLCFPGFRKPGLLALWDLSCFSPTPTVWQNQQSLFVCENFSPAAAAAKCQQSAMEQWQCSDGGIIGF